MDPQRPEMPVRKRSLVSTPLPFDTVELAPTDGGPVRELILLLHGFSESGERILQKLAQPAAPAIPPALRARALVLAPHAPFLVSRRPTYSWYFYDPATDEYAIDMQPAIEFLRAGLEARGLLELPKRVIGFSQGGYLAPIAATRLGLVIQCIGIGCETLVDEIPGKHPPGVPQPLPFRVDVIHGALDESVSPTRARESHARLMATGTIGSFKMIEDSGHKIDDGIRLAVSEILGS